MLAEGARASMQRAPWGTLRVHFTHADRMLRGATRTSTTRTSTTRTAMTHALLMLVGFAITAAALPAARALAYCRETVDTSATGPCIEEPDSPRLTWSRPCMTYVFEEHAFERMPLLSEEEIRSTFQTSFNTWAATTCDGREPFLAVQDPGTTDTFDSVFVYDVPNESIVVARTRSEWAGLEQSSVALALTLLWHDVNTGEILDVDMELNTGAGRFANCDASCGRDMMDLENTITHEAGHVLGLGHSTVDDSTMEEAASDGEIKKRSLEPDDLAGYCSLDLPSPDCDAGACVCEDPPIFPSQRSVTTCGCRLIGTNTLGTNTPGTSTQDTGAWTLLCAALALAWRQRARARSCRATPQARS
jgi:hypothetical protein